MGLIEMRNEYEIEKLNPRKNPYAKSLKKPVTMSMRESTIEYFKEMSKETGIPYQTIMNFFLDECARKKKTISFDY